MRSTCPSEGERLRLVEGTLGGSDRERVESHVATCEDCGARVRALERLTEALRGAVRGAPEEAASCRESERVSGYADGTLAAGEASQVEAHLARCPSCSALLADLWRSPDGAAERGPDRAVDRVLGRLEREGRSAVVRIAERTLTVVTGFARSGAAALGAGLLPVSETALAAAARAEPGEIRLSWVGSGGIALEGRVRLREGAPTLIARVTADGKPARAISVALRTPGSTRGPESPDPEGRIGPWPVEIGRNTVVLSGIDLDGGRLELELELVTHDRPDGE